MMRFDPDGGIGPGAVTAARQSPGNRCRPFTGRRAPECLPAEPRKPFLSVVAYAMQGVSSFGLSAVSNIFADRTRIGLPAFEFTVCSDHLGLLRTDLGLLMQVTAGPEAIAGADLVILLPTEARPLTLHAPIAEAVKSAYRRGAIVSAYCTGTLLLASTGLLDDRRIATNWEFAAQLAQLHPAITIDGEALYADEGRIVTGAAAASGIDMCLHLLRREHGSSVANGVAREAMVASRRESGHVHSFLPVSPGDRGVHSGSDDTPLAEVLAWARGQLDRALSVNEMARQALMSPRTFARRFREATGTTPHAWVLEQRLNRAEELLETTDLPIHKIAQEVGFRSDSVLREHFTRRRGVAPRDYRRAVGRRS